MSCALLDCPWIEIWCKIIGLYFIWCLNFAFQTIIFNIMPNLLRPFLRGCGLRNQPSLLKAVYELDWVPLAQYSLWLCYELIEMSTLYNNANIKIAMFCHFWNICNSWYQSLRSSFEVIFSWESDRRLIIFQ